MYDWEFILKMIDSLHQYPGQRCMSKMIRRAYPNHRRLICLDPLVVQGGLYLI